MIEHYRRLAYIQQTMLWDGSADTAAAIKAWVGDRDDGSRFLLPAEVTGVVANAVLWVDHSQSWLPVPIGHRVVAELDGSGFYPLSPAGLRAGFESFPVVCSCSSLAGLHPQAGSRRESCPIHSAPLPPRRPGTPA